MKGNLEPMQRFSTMNPEDIMVMSDDNQDSMVENDALKFKNAIKVEKN